MALRIRILTFHHTLNRMVHRTCLLPLQEAQRHHAGHKLLMAVRETRNKLALRLLRRLRLHLHRLAAQHRFRA